MVRFSHVDKGFQGKSVLTDFSYPFSEGRSYVLLGESGGGKTTLLRLIMGLEEADAGEIQKKTGLRISAVFQEDRLLEDRTVSRNLRMPLTGMPREEQDRRIREGLASLGLSGCEGTLVSTLSGGMKRRVAILRALLTEAELYLFDEACRGLDEENKRRTMEEILRATKGKTVLWVTHDREELSYFPEGKILEIGKAQGLFDLTSKERER